MNKLDITSTVLEKGIDLAKSFLDKLIAPAIEETGLLIKDSIAKWRFNNQVQALNKAREYCIKHDISPKQISFKLICPLLDYASLEDNEILQDKWGILLANMVDSEQNIENHVFPYILSQISINEYKALEMTFDHKLERIKNLKAEIKGFKENYPQKERELIKKIKESKSDIRLTFRFEKELRDLKYQETKLNISLKEPEILGENEIQEFEVLNLVRLGLAKSVIQHYVHAEPIKIPYRGEEEYPEDLNIDVEVGIEQDYEYYILTELGELFIKACSEKS